MQIPMIPPGAWLGLLGGGQLGRMFCMAAQSLGYRVAVLDPGSESPAGSVADRHVQADYLDQSGLAELAELCLGVTTEFENVPAQSLLYLAEHVRVSPTAASVAIAQNRIAEKQFIAACGLAVVPHAVINEAKDLHAVSSHLFPAILKISRLGYDGKGQARVADVEEALAAFASMGEQACVLEKMLDLVYEISVVVARDASGQTVSYPVAENVHRHGILAVSTVPATSASAEVQQQATQAALKIAEQMAYVGVLCVEFFMVQDAAHVDYKASPHLIVNEIAPRPHNSGHYSLNACVASQFEQQARILAGLPLASTRLHSPTVMLNLLGDLWFSSDVAATRHKDHNIPHEPDWAKVLGYPEAHLHLYGKREARPGRKMGHITITAATAMQADATARDIALDLGLPDW